MYTALILPPPRRSGTLPYDMDVDIDRIMNRCLELAARGGRAVMPNPMVGAALVYQGNIISEGYHELYGGPHAEVQAIRNLENRELLRESTLFVTLEPCSHFGKTPPCADLVIESGIRSVVVGCLDPFPAVSGKGIEKLRAAGITVTEGVQREACIDLNRRFILAHRSHRPYIILKWAQTSDRFVARGDYTSKWISSEQSRRLVHQWRSEEMSILVGATTAVMDNPQLTVRDIPGVSPVRILIDRQGRVPRSHTLLSSAPPETWVFTERREHDIGAGKRFLLEANKPSLPQILAALYDAGIISLFVEGGAATLRSFIESAMWDEARVFTAQTSFGNGIKAPTLTAVPYQTTQSGEDVLEMYRHPDLKRRLGL